MMRMLRIMVGSLTALLTGGCSNLLPTIDQSVEFRWNSYEEVKQSFDRIQPGQTTVEDLKELGFDPFENPNIRVLNYLEITQRFIPNASIRLVDLHPAIRACLEAKTACQGYEISPKILHSQRYGNVVLDVFNFRRKTRTTGWSFQGLMVVNAGQVVYKLAGGQPSVLELEDKENPLGPLQDMSVNPSIPLE